MNWNLKTECVFQTEKMCEGHVLHTYAYRCTFTDFCVDSLHRYTDTGSQDTWCLHMHTGMYSHAHTGRDVFQGEGTMAQGT